MNYRVQIREGKERFENHYFPSFWEVRAFIPTIVGNSTTVIDIHETVLWMDANFQFEKELIAWRERNV